MDTQSPFQFGSLVSGDGFLNRTEELKRLEFNIRSGNSSILISPRRWGKSSLVKQVANKLKKEKDYVFCFIDLFPLKSEEEFYVQYAQLLLRAFHNKVDALLQAARDFLAKASPGLSFSLDPNTDIKLQFNWKDEQSASSILELGQKLAAKHKKKLVVCLDEFQNIEQFIDPVGFQRQLRTHWQHQNDVCFVIYGSMRHMMQQIFADTNYPFYRFGEIINLPPIATDEWVTFIVKRFRERGKSISPVLAADLVESVSQHSQYVQHLAHIAYYHCTEGGELNKNQLDASIKQLMHEQTALFQLTYERLSKDQTAALRMLVDGITRHFSQKETFAKYGFSSSSAVYRALNGLEKKAVLERFGTDLHFADPVFKLWLKELFASL